ncbi:RadC family protein [Gynurincola endophyticus]|jgi:DNA repair protein RadC|uniref:RadC family protein n=1 Tax=Gynurincola endophyticus TaxID=2479004 RepID=UPI000F8EFB01|nr:DNA repair protein RadC [Gynurincola endophyticus]
MKTSIKNWSKFDQPREKLLSTRPHLISNAELLAVIINQGSKQKSALGLAYDLLGKSQNNLIRLSQLTIQELMQLNGIGVTKAAKIIACIELAKRFMITEKIPSSKISDPKSAIEFAKASIQFFPYEVFHVIFLNNANKVISFENLSEGSITATIADPRIIFKRALELGAIKLILCHNHPSGNAAPSDADIRLTRKLSQAAQLLDLSVIDHLIITTEQYYSFAENGYV